MRGTPIVVIALMVLPAALTAQRELRDVPYVPGGDRAQQLDLYLPSVRDFPTLVLVHGGSLTQGDKRDDAIPAVCRTIALSGVACVSVNYRLGPTPRWPAQPEDVAAAIGWVRRHIEDHGGDSSKLVLGGHSSGCMLVSILATEPSYLAGQQLALDDIRGVVAMGCTLSPVLPAISDPVRLRSVFTDGALATMGSLETFIAANPTAHVSTQTPPFLVLIAESEQVNPPILERANVFAQKMRETGRAVEIHVLPGRNHYTALSEMQNSDDRCLQIMLRFLQRSTASE